jgi:hypothetical protein
LAENQNNTDVKTNTIIIVSQTDASNTVKNLSTLEMGLGQGTNHLIATESYGIDGSVIPVTTIGSRGIIPTTTSEIPDVNFEASVITALIEMSSEG